jgi:hypothetical protein
MDGPSDDAASDDGAAAGDIFRKLFASLLPERSCYGGMRRFEAGYRRMCALAFVLAPELFHGLDGKQVAKTLGMSENNWRKLLAGVRAEISGRQVLPTTRGSGSSPHPTTHQVPERPEPSERVKCSKLSKQKASK